jgi:hypothetical protein
MIHSVYFFIWFYLDLIKKMILVCYFRSQIVNFIIYNLIVLREHENRSKYKDVVHLRVTCA